MAGVIFKTFTYPLIQFLNAVLSSIGGEGQSPSLPRAQSSRPGSSHSGLLNDRDCLSARKGLQSSTSDLKRKAEDVLSRSNDKVAKESKMARPSAGLPTMTSRQGVKVSRPAISTSSSAIAMPYRGTSKAIPNSTSPLTPVGDTPKAAPKKGSYAEIMARAKTSQTAVPDIGAIRHKPKETLSNKKEILLHKKGRLNKSKPGLKDSPGRDVPPDGRQYPGSGPLAKRTKSDNGVPSKKAVAPPTYKGTATAKPQPSYKGTMKPVAPPNQPGRKNSTLDKGPSRSRSVSMGRPSISHNRYGRYLSEDEEDEEFDEDEDDGDVGGESSDDMEAGFSDVEEEEQHAIKFAKKEDEEQAKIELQLKREKEERKKRLELMAKSAKKRSF
ncbi:hypothetical protein MMC07_006937 [Pseudocyphellaria aurata]|nr:hypothetical protein [Pseudocyphellaria aurata]